MDQLLSARCWEAFAAKAEESPRQAERMEVIRKVRSLRREYRMSGLLFVRKKALADSRTPRGSAGAAETSSSLGTAERKSF